MNRKASCHLYGTVYSFRLLHSLRYCSVRDLTELKQRLNSMHLRTTDKSIKLIILPNYLNNFDLYMYVSNIFSSADRKYSYLQR
jgi:hypothetical protein